MPSRMRWAIGAALAVGIAAAGVGVGVAQTDGGESAETEGTDQERPLTGADRERAAQAALEAVGGGTVIEVEVGDDGAAYGVEIRLDDGSPIEVQLDESFTVTGTEPDDE